MRTIQWQIKNKMIMEKKIKNKDVDFDTPQDNMEKEPSNGNGGGVSGQPYVSIDSEDDGSRNPWITFAVIAIVALTLAVVVLLLTL